MVKNVGPIPEYFMAIRQSIKFAVMASKMKEAFVN